MKAVQTRSPIHIFINSPGTNFTRAGISIWVSDNVNINTNSTPDYQLTSTPINGIASFEISELIRSKNDYIFDSDFYEKRDTAKYVLVKCDTFVNSNFFLARSRYDFLRIRDGYVQRVNNVTEKELPQIFDRLISENIGDWFQSTVSTTTGIQDPFNGSNATKKTLFSFRDYTISAPLTKSLNTGTFSMYYRVYENTPLTFDVLSNGTSQGSADIRLGTKAVTFFNAGGSVDIIELNNNWNLLSISFNNFTPIDEIVLEFTNLGEIMNLDLLSFSLREGDNLQSEASELILQDNYEVIKTLFPVKLMVDKKYTNGDYKYFNLNFTFPSGQSEYLTPFNGSYDLIYDNLRTSQQDFNETRQTLTGTVVNECKHTPVKVSFINRFGVIQDLYFFKKRTDNIDTDKESYKTNVLQFGNYYSHIGQNQTISKESKRSVTLNSGFYPEEFNTVFEQLQNSLYYWIDDEPAVLEGSTFNVKTRVNDKLINYTFDFSYSNEEVNTI